MPSTTGPVTGSGGWDVQCGGSNAGAADSDSSLCFEEPGMAKPEFQPRSSAAEDVMRSCASLLESIFSFHLYKPLTVPE